MSIAAQRRELQRLADDRGYIITQEYTDVVESAKDANRPGFQSLLKDLKSSSRQWSTLLLVDTSRLSRRRYMAQVFKHEAKKRGVTILYSKIPESDPIVDMVIIGVLEVFDEMHSLMSKEKGLAGMRENVAQGYRAGGRAPLGYRLDKIETGAVRDGANVTKSKLVPDDKAPIVRRYLKHRAAGLSRSRAAEKAGIQASKASLNGIEWNALTYAGHTVWNVHNEFSPGEGYKGGIKRKPREDWVINHNTHEPLITEDEAETILEQLQGRRRSYKTAAKYLLTGLLVTPDNQKWYGEADRYYRTKAGGSWAQKSEIENAVIDAIVNDTQSDQFVAEIIKESRNTKITSDPAADLRQRLQTITHSISKTMDLAGRLEDPAPALRKVDELERARKQLEQEIAITEAEYKEQLAMASITEEQARAIFADVNEVLKTADRDELKDRLPSILERIELDPATMECSIHYRIQSRKLMASPRQRREFPVIKYARKSRG